MFIFHANADRIYIINNLTGGGYNYAEPQLINALISNGHTVVVNSTVFNSLPSGFTSTCIDPVNGYDWLCFFGDYDYSALLNDVKTFIDLGGKVFYQYEVSCCNNSTTGASTMASGLTGLSITPSSNLYIAGNLTPQAGWADSLQNNCVTIVGNAYRCLNGIPASNQLNATANLNGSTPPYTVCSNFGFHFSSIDFLGTAHNGAMIGLGDINLFYDGDEPFWNNGTTPINMNVIDFLFPNTQSQCNLFPSGCSLTGVSELNSINNQIDIFPNPNKGIFTLELNKFYSYGEVQIINIIGENIYSKNFQQASKLQFNLANISSGIYIIKVFDGVDYFCKKLIIEQD
jgi:hypothetical protein